MTKTTDSLIRSLDAAYADFKIQTALPFLDSLISEAQNAGEDAEAVRLATWADGIQHNTMTLQYVRNQLRAAKLRVAGRVFLVAANDAYLDMHSGNAAELLRDLSRLAGVAEYWDAEDLATWARAVDAGTLTVGSARENVRAITRRLA